MTSYQFDGVFRADVIVNWKVSGPDVHDACGCMECHPEQNTAGVEPRTTLDHRGAWVTEDK